MPVEQGVPVEKAPSTVAADNGDEEEPHHGARCRKWVFTWFDYPEVTDQVILGLFQSYFGKDLRYIAWGRELCPTTKRPHLQAFVYFHEAKVLGKPLVRGGYTKGSLKGFHKTIRWAMMRSDCAHNQGYCAKYGKQPLFEWGVPPAEEGPGGGRGARTDLQGLAYQIVDGTITRDEMYEHHPEMMVKFQRGFENLFMYLRPHRSGRPIVMWMTGVSGSGKSEFPEIVHGRDKVYRKMNGGLFFNDYRNQEAVVIEEFARYSASNPRGWIFTEFLQLLDKYEISVEIKGSYAKFDSPFIYITSVKHPKEFFPDMDEFTQVLRRIDGIYTIYPDGRPEIDREYVPYYFDRARVPREIVVPYAIAADLAAVRLRREAEAEKRRQEIQMRVAQRALAQRGRISNLSNVLEKPQKQEDEA